MSNTQRRVSALLLLAMLLVLAGCGAAPAVEETAGSTTAPVAAEPTVAPAEEPAAEATTAPDTATEATAAPDDAAPVAEGPTPVPTLEPGPNAVTIEYWEMNWGYTPALQERVNEFNKQNPDIYVKLTQLEWGDYTQKLLGAIGAGSPPDISGGDGGMPFNFYAQDQVLPLDELYNQFKADGRFDDMTEWAQNKWNYDGKQVGVSWQIDARGIFYRKDLFEQAGITTLPTTHDELLAVATKLTDRSKEQYGICVPGKQGSYDTDQFYMTLVLQNGGGLADAEGNPTFDTPEHLEALRFEKELVDAAAPEGTPANSFGELQALYQQGKCAMVFQGGFFVNNLTNEAPDMVEKTGLLPALKGRGPKATQRIVGFYNPWMVYKQSDHPTETLKFLDFMMQPENLEKVYASDFGGHGSIYKSLQTSEVYTSNPLTQELAEQISQYSVDYWYPNNVAGIGIGSLGTSITDIIVNPVLVGARTPEDALKDAQEQLAPLFERQSQ